MPSEFGGRVGPAAALLLATLANPGIVGAQDRHDPAPEACGAGPTLTYLANVPVLPNSTH